MNIYFLDSYLVLCVFRNENWHFLNIKRKTSNSILENEILIINLFFIFSSIKGYFSLDICNPKQL